MFSSVEVETPQADQKEKQGEAEQDRDLGGNIGNAEVTQHQAAEGAISPILRDDLNHWTQELVQESDGDEGTAEDTQTPNQQAGQAANLVFGAGNGGDQDTEGSRA